MKSEEKVARRKLLKHVTFDAIRPYITGRDELGGETLNEADVSWVTSQVIHRVRKILDYPGRRLGVRSRRKVAE